MNCILCEPEEINDDLSVALNDRRSDHIRTVLKLAPGDTARIGMVGGSLGTGTVTAITSDTVHLALNLAVNPAIEPPIDLILALPRPIMLQRILSLAAPLGIARIFLIRSRRVEKSFFSASLLQPHESRHHLKLGMEQAMDTWLPEIAIFPRFRPFVEDFLPTHLPRCPMRLLPHPGTSSLLPEIAPPPLADRTIIAVGPEGGWVDFEIDRFREAGFTPFGMGRKIYRVETAITVLAGQLALLRDWPGAV